MQMQMKLMTTEQNSNKHKKNVKIRMYMIKKNKNMSTHFFFSIHKIRIIMSISELTNLGHRIELHCLEYETKYVFMAKLT